MITCSYRSYFQGYISYKFYKIIIYFNRFYFFQKYIIKLALKITNDPKLIALDDYLRLLNSPEYKPSLKRYPNLELSKLNRYEKLDIYDLCEEIYQEKYLNETNIPDKKYSEITYIVEKSGFFSTIFTVTCIAFYCLKNGIKLHINWDAWPYSYDIGYLFDDEKQEVFKNQSKGQGVLFQDARRFIDNLQDSSYGLSEFFEYRKYIIKELYNSALYFLKPDYINNYKNKIAVFIRRGDKLLNESYPIPINAYTKILGAYPNILILGDDYYFNSKLSSKIAGSEIYEIIGYKPRGGYLNNSGDIAVKSILGNFIILCVSSRVIGDPYCNLVAAALIYRNENRSYDSRIAPWKLRNYV